jgi:DNA-directed RNA polymerase specialized sigma24 family protein
VDDGPGVISGVDAIGGASVDDVWHIGGLSDKALQKLRQLFVARYGWELGLEAWHDAVAYSWEHNERLAAMPNAFGYLYRVGQSSIRRQRRWRRGVAFPPVPPDRLPDVEPGLPRALAALSPRQRAVVLLVHAHGWTQEEAATALQIDVSTLRNHLRRGLGKLRKTLGVEGA